MSYGLRYTSRFKNDIAKDIYRIEILEKDFTGDSIELAGSETPFTADYSAADTDILTPIKPVELTISLLAKKETLIPVYSGNDDVNISTTFDTITVLHQTTDPGIAPGMVLVVDGRTFHITGVEYSLALTDLILSVAEPITADEFLNDVDFAFYWPLSIDAFYSDDDEKFRVDFYFESFEDGTGTEKLLYTGYIIQEGASEAVTDRTHVIILKATDNLGLLKQTTWDKSSTLGVYGHNGSGSLYRMIQDIIFTTGLEMPVNVWANVFENTMNDRDDIDTAEPFRETTFIFSTFQNSDGTWQNCYDILSTILSSFNACVFMALGEWHIMRIAEYKLFNKAIPGTYSFGFTGNAVTLDDAVIIDRNNLVHPIAEDQIKSFERPLQFVKETFNYQQPKLLKQADLQMAAGAIPYDTSTDSGIRTDKYDLAIYFPDWVQRNGDASYLAVIVDTTVTPEQEIDRFIVTPSANDDTKGVQFNPISVSQKDYLDFSLQIKTYTSDTNDAFLFGVRFILLTETDIYSLVQFPDEVSDPDHTRLLWHIIADNTLWDSSTQGVPLYITDSDANDIDTSIYMPWELNARTKGVIPVIPADGILLIQVDGTNDNFSENQTVAWKDINLTLNQYINESLQITGHIHTSTGQPNPKATEEINLTIDDSPRNSIAGTLFTDALTDFNYTDTNTGEVTGITNVYFTRTQSWHRSNLTEALRLGEITTMERLILQYTRRSVIEGTFRNVRYDDDKFISLLTAFSFGWLPQKTFLPASLTIDYKNNSFKTRAIEIYNDHEDLYAYDYLFNYIYDVKK